MTDPAAPQPEAGAPRPAPSDEGPSRTEPRSGPSLGRPLLLFFLTLCTTTWAGIVNVHGGVPWDDVDQLLSVIPDGLPYALSIMGILLTHEMGHYLAARRHGVKASLPYFIPLPHPLVGTMGAVIKMEGRFESRDALADIGAAGPLAGLAVALPVLAYGLHLSPVRPMQTGTVEGHALLQGGLRSLLGSASAMGSPLQALVALPLALGGLYLAPALALPFSLQEGNSLLYLGLKALAKGALLPGDGLDVFLHPVAWAGWVGLLVTMLNLMPIGQLDGGHIAHAYFGPVHNRISAWLHRGLLLLALFGMTLTTLELMKVLPFGEAVTQGVQSGIIWFVWWIIHHVLRRLSGGVYHPPVAEKALSRRRRFLCLAMLVLFFVLLTPVPLRVNYITPLAPPAAMIPVP